MVVSPVMQVGVHIRFEGVTQRLEEIVDELGGELSDTFAAKLDVELQIRRTSSYAPPIASPSARRRLGRPATESRPL
jgi:hypothetical protein